MITETTYEQILQNFIQATRRRRLCRIPDIAEGLCKVLREIVVRFVPKTDKLSTLLNLIKKTGVTLEKKFPTLFVMGNIVRRVLFHIREEIYLELHPEESSDLDVYHKRTIDDIFFRDDSNEFDQKKDEKLDVEQKKDIKLAIINEINELIDELEDALESIAKESINEIHNNEVILTIGHSHTVYEFLEKASQKKIKFKAIVTEESPLLAGHIMAKKLARLGIQTTLIPDSAIFAVMSRVNKVIIGTNAVMANGGLITPSGSHIIAMAAKKHSVPVVVCSAIYKFTPLYPSQNTKKFLKLKNPNDVMPSLVDKPRTHIINPTFDYVQPELVSLFITNYGIHTPSYIYRILAEYYDPIDYILKEDEGMEKKKLFSKQ